MEVYTWENHVSPYYDPWYWYIYLQNLVIFRVNVGKYMEHLGSGDDINNAM